jgi:signal transduction histidine kinase/CheY-like chemotaxis protein
LPDAPCAILLRSPDEASLHCVAERGLADELRRAIDGLALNTPLAGCLAAPVLANARALSSDIAADPTWASARPLVLPHRLRASWAVPIGTLERGARGMIAVYQTTPQTPTPRDWAMLDAAARLIGVALERSDAQQQLARQVRALDDARVAAERQSVELAEARDHALASMRARSQFLANMSHEIRTPLNGIIGTTEILLDTKLTSSQEEYARILSHCADHLLGVINDILDLSKIEAGKVEIEHVDVDLADLLEEVADVFAVRAHEKGLELATSVAPELATLVRGDPSRLRQVLVNLVGNAIKFTERGEVVIDGRLLRESATDCVVRLAVRDTGVGIPLERQTAVFDSFTQADGSTTRTYGGSGLGLTISRELVQLMGGHIGLDSQPGAGSTFWIDLPFERSPATAGQKPAPLSLKGLRVLVVDDTATNRLVLRQSLREWGCRVDEAASGREALHQLAQGAECPFDFVVLDMQMPELDGLATARRIKGDPRLAAMPLILLSSIGDIDGGAHGATYRDCFAAVVTKPVRRSVLLNAIRDALGRPAPSDEAVRPARSSRSLGLRVLLAEDNRVNQLVAQRLLDKLGCHTEVVDNGRAAVEAVARAQYDVVLMDIQMPLIDGFEATAMIRRHEAVGERVPIIAMTAHAMEGDSERCIGAGMDGYISKPVRLAALADALSGLSATETRDTG